MGNIFPFKTITELKSTDWNDLRQYSLTLFLSCSCYVQSAIVTLLRSTKENAFIVRSDFENFGPFIDTDLAPPKNSSGAKLFRENDVIFIGHVLNLVLRLSLLCLLNEVAMCFVSTRSSVSLCLASWCASLFSLTFSSRLVYFLVEFWTLLPCLFYMFTITIA